MRNFWYRHRLKIILVIALLLRVVLVVRGGQFMYPDETRLGYSVTMLENLYAGDTQAALTSFIQVIDHTGFVLVGLPAALVEGVKVALFGRAMPGEYIGAALVLMLYSVANIRLIYSIAKRAGASNDEAFMAMMFMAISSSMFYYARHIFPYDASLFFILLGLYISYRPNPRFSTAVWSGFWVACGALTYNGYWLVGGLTLLVPLYLVWSRGQGLRKGINTLVGVVIGGLLPFFIIFVICTLVRFDFAIWVDSVRRFSQTIDQGDPREGWSFIWEYLWAAETLLLIVWLIGGAFAIRTIWASKNPFTQRGVVWLLIIVLLYSVYSLLSTGLGSYVMYGRLVRVFVPFFCLLAAYGFAHSWSAFSTRTRMALYGVVIVFTTLQFATPLMQRFPNEFEHSARKAYPDDISVLPATTLFYGFDAEDTRYIIYGVDVGLDAETIIPFPEGVTLWHAASPWQYPPYLYEGFKPDARARLRSADIAMRLIDTRPAAAP